MIPTCIFLKKSTFQYKTFFFCISVDTKKFAELHYPSTQKQDFPVVVYNAFHLNADFDF